MKILNVLSKKIKQNFLSYSLALILNKEKKVCTKMAECLKITHYFLYRVFRERGLLLPVFSAPGAAIHPA